MNHLGDSPATPARLRQLPSRLLNIAAAHADRLVTAGLGAEDARKWHYAVLVALSDGGPASQAALSDRTGIYRSDLVAVINELEERGFVERTPDPDDRRRNVVTVTATGRGWLERLERVLEGLQEEVLAPLSEEERRVLVGLLARLVEHHRG
ncbi:MarR family winged helix-turn-helix transcriptional regulator [Nonomuraea sp. NPDC050663]|uniref:MarR family winged helix-turn-helix transcriptional regulator n=1 Tax=Nonomuraea sp. NPDC050663 TaxID=3364370 RepID=UPI0037BC8FA9